MANPQDLMRRSSLNSASPPNIPNHQSPPPPAQNNTQGSSAPVSSQNPQTPSTGVTRTQSQSTGMHELHAGPVPQPVADKPKPTTQAMKQYKVGHADLVRLWGNSLTVSEPPSPRSLPCHSLRISWLQWARQARHRALHCPRWPPHSPRLRHRRRLQRQLTRAAELQSPQSRPRSPLEHPDLPSRPLDRLKAPRMAQAASRRLRCRSQSSPE